MVFARIFEVWAERRQVREAHDFLDRLKAMNSDELGLPLVSALEIAEMFLEESRQNLFDPFSVMASQPSVIMELHKVISELRRLDRSILVGGAMVWVHSLRATVNHKVRPIAREIWAEMLRGAPYAEDARSLVCDLFEMWPSLDKLGQVPKGLELGR